MFKIYQEYERQELTGFVGSNQLQTGIISGYKQPGSVIITSGGRHGKRVGYTNQQFSDGSWLYIGQGGEGDQNINAPGNKLLAEKRDVLLFSTREPNAHEVRLRGNHRKLYKFEGIFDVAGWEYKKVSEGERKGDTLLFFYLVPACNIYTGLENDKVENFELPSNLRTLKDRINIKIDARPGNRQEAIRIYHLRSAMVKKYALLRANGNCELCGKPAPFANSLGVPFLEVHHILKLADDGPDKTVNVAALCPNCHREAHYGIKAAVIKSTLIKTINEKDTSIS
ncbi:HNH endonuclease [Mucilaginibacter sp. Mucisp84]|uniref:HNH endonuclease n=1 Tax=Mucilaginibacter sp. Mucisp84 TaxID=3243058 RepID=UPI0039A56AD0